jgi:hypothetical protein
MRHVHSVQWLINMYECSSEMMFGNIDLKGDDENFTNNKLLTSTLKDTCFIEWHV